MAPIVRPPCNLAGRQAQVCRGRAGHPARAGSAAGPQSRTSEAPPDGRALGKGPGAAAGALLFLLAATAASRGRAPDAAVRALRRERGLAFAGGLVPLQRRFQPLVTQAVSQSNRAARTCFTSFSSRR